MKPKPTSTKLPSASCCLPEQLDLGTRGRTTVQYSSPISSSNGCTRRSACSGGRSGTTGRSRPGSSSTSLRGTPRRARQLLRREERPQPVAVEALLEGDEPELRVHHFPAVLAFHHCHSLATLDAISESVAVKWRAHDEATAWVATRDGRRSWRFRPPVACPRSRAADSARIGSNHGPRATNHLPEPVASPISSSSRARASGRSSRSPPSETAGRRSRRCGRRWRSRRRRRPRSARRG